jgi:hypothetical protein
VAQWDVRPPKILQLLLHLVELCGRRKCPVRLGVHVKSPLSCCHLHVVSLSVQPGSRTQTRPPDGTHGQLAYHRHPLRDACNSSRNRARNLRLTFCCTVALSERLHSLGGIDDSFIPASKFDPFFGYNRCRGGCEYDRPTGWMKRQRRPADAHSTADVLRDVLDLIQSGGGWRPGNCSPAEQESESSSE